MPNRVSIWIVLFIVFFNGGYAMMAGFGVWDHMGADPDPGGTEVKDDITDTTDPRNVDPQGGGLSTLFGLISALYNNTIGVVLNKLLPGIAMLGNLNIVPDAVVDFLQLASVIAGIDAAAYLRGYNL